MVVEILYQKVADDIKKNILSGTYEVGSLIPTENELEQKYDVSKITIRKRSKN
jgi:Transcriptional regulators